VIEEEPPPGVPLLGLYQGFPLTTRGRAYAGVPPDKITIYRRPLERRYAADPARLRREIRRVVYTRWRTTSASATSVSSRSVATNSCSTRARSALSPLVVPQILGRERLAAAFWALPRR
jgi:hypothetical protein